MPIEFLDTQCVGICTPDTLRTNMEAAVARGYPMVRKFDANKPLAIVGGGPSVADDIEELRNWPGDIWAVNGALGWLMERGIKPHAFVLMDPHPSMAQFLTDPPDGVVYYIISVADPAVFECLAGKNVILWNGTGKEVPPPKGFGSIGGGPTILSRAPMLAYALGHRNVHLFGADSSYEHGDHSYEVTIAEGVPLDELIHIELDGIVYPTSLVMVHQTAYFQSIKAWYDERGATFEIHGKGLGPAVLKAHMHTIEEVERDAQRNHEAA